MTVRTPLGSKSMRGSLKPSHQHIGQAYDRRHRYASIARVMVRTSTSSTAGPIADTPGCRPARFSRSGESAGKLMHETMHGAKKKPQHPFKSLGSCGFLLCARGELNPHALAGTRT